LRNSETSCSSQFVEKDEKRTNAYEKVSLFCTYVVVYAAIFERGNWKEIGTMSAILAQTPHRMEETELPQRTQRLLEELERERILAYSDMLAHPNQENPTRLEQSVDALLDSLYSLRRLEELALNTARGKSITVDADLALIAANEETYRRLLEKHLIFTGNTAIVSDGLLPAFPQPIE
jgi:hypothetical protein